jgi:hypothetical protein
MKVRLNPRYPLMDAGFRLAVKILARHLKRAVRKDPYNCLIAQAIRQTIGITDPLGVWIGYRFCWVLLPNKGQLTYVRFMSDGVLQEHYDNGHDAVGCVVTLLPISPSLTLAARRKRNRSYAPRVGPPVTRVKSESHIRGRRTDDEN